MISVIRLTSRIVNRDPSISRQSGRGNLANMSCSDALRLSLSSSYLLEAEKEFVQTYESFPILWDKTNLNYKIKYKRDECLEKLLVIYKKLRPHATISDVRKKINSLKSNYRREWKKVILSRYSGDGEEYVPKSWLYECLHFLNKLEQPLTEVLVIRYIKVII